MKLGYVFNFFGSGGATSQAWDIVGALKKHLDVEAVNAMEYGLFQEVVQEHPYGVKCRFPVDLLQALGRYNPVILHSYNAGFVQACAEHAYGLVGIRSGSNFLEYHITQAVAQNPRWLGDLMCEMDVVDFMIAPSEYHEKQLRYLYEDMETFVIPVGVNVEAYHPTPPKVLGKLRVLVACRNAPNNFVSAILAVARRLKDVHFTFIGMGLDTYVRTCQLLVQKWGLKNVEMLGYVDEITKKQQMELADVLCVPSISHNGLPVSVCEALAAGTAVITSKMPVIDAPVTQIQIDDFEEWEAKIRMFDECGDALEKVMARGREFVETHHDMEKVIVPKYLDMFERLGVL